MVEDIDADNVVVVHPRSREYVVVICGETHLRMSGLGLVDIYHNTFHLSNMDSKNPCQTR